MGGKGNSASERQAARKEDRQRKDAYRKMKKKERGNGRWKDTYVEFGEQLKQIGLRFRDTKPDGNCLFRALADQLEGIENGHAAFRGRVVRGASREGAA
jgi:OTU domain-containing protein 3